MSDDGEFDDSESNDIEEENESTVWSSEEELRYDVLTWAHSSLDGVSRSLRQSKFEVLQRILQVPSQRKNKSAFLDDDEAGEDAVNLDSTNSTKSGRDRQRLVSLLASYYQDIPCHTMHAARRIVSLYKLAIESVVDHSVDENDQSTLHTLCRALCWHLAQSVSRPGAVQTVHHHHHKNHWPTSSSLVEHVIATWNQNIPHETTRLATLFRNVAVEASASSAISTPTMGIAAVALGFALDSVNHDVAATEWVSLLVSHCTTHFSDATELSLAQPLWTFMVSPSPSGAENDIWTTTVSTLLCLKVKSHPDRALVVVHGWITHLAQTCQILNSKSGTGGSPVASAAAVATMPRLTDEWSTLLIKHVSSKVDNGRWAAATLIQWTVAAGSYSRTISALSKACTDAKPPFLAPARVAIYDVYRSLALAYSVAAQRARSSALPATPVEEANVWDKAVFASLSALLSKETRVEHQTVGIGALVEWMLAAAADGNESNSDYQTALCDWIQTPLLQMSKATSNPLSLPILSCLVERATAVSPELVSAIVSHLWMIRDQARWDKGLESIVQLAGTKKSMQSDGIVIVYLCLVNSAQTQLPPPLWCTKVVAAGVTKKLDDSSFLYTPSLMELVRTDRLLCHIVLHLLTIHTQLAFPVNGSSPSSDLGSIFVTKNKSSTATAASRLWARCFIHWQRRRDEPTGDVSLHTSETSSILDWLASIVTHEPQSSEFLVRALMDQVNDTSQQWERTIYKSNESREGRESETDDIASIIVPTFDSSAIRYGAKLLSQNLGVSAMDNETCIDIASCLAKVLVLMHTETTLKGQGRQRTALIENTYKVVGQVLTNLKSHSDFSAFESTVRHHTGAEIVRLAAGDAAVTLEDTAVDNPASTTSTSRVLHSAALSLLISLGCITDRFDEEDKPSLSLRFVKQMCVSDIAPGLSSHLKAALLLIEELSTDDIEVYRSRKGTLFRNETTAATSNHKPTAKRLTEEEEWELQLVKELESKKNGGRGDSGVLSTEERKLLEQQDIKRSWMSTLFQVKLYRVLKTIRYFCSSSIKIGNECLPSMAYHVLRAAVSICPAFSLVRTFREQALEALTALGSCVYEIHEIHAPTMAIALITSCHVDSTKAQKTSAVEESIAHFQVSALPSPCASAACVVEEMDRFQDTFSFASFSFLFPVIKAVLTGARTPSGCESALKVLKRHADLLHGERVDPEFKRLRKEMVVTVLELLKYDRAKTFIEPTPFETLVVCYSTDPEDSTLTTTELAPLLDERASLGSKSCRIGAMLALTRIASDQRKVVKMNPLMENRIWLNCFERDLDIRAHARKAWATVHDTGENHWLNDESSMPKPSPLYAAPLFPLLSHSNPSISLSAAEAYACAMGLNPSSVSRNVEALCSMYIDMFPAVGDAGAKSSLPPSAGKAKSSSAIATVKKASTGLPKKKITAAPKSALAVAGIGQPKVSIKKKTAVAALLKPKQERTLDQEELANQFKATATLVTTKPEQDSLSKIAGRKGVLQAVTAISSSPVKVDMNEATLKLLTSFLMAYGIADSAVHGAARDALRDVVASNGGTDEAVSFLLPHLEVVLKTGAADENALGGLAKEKVPKDVTASDRRKEGAVVALGSVALHLQGEENDEKVRNSVDMLFAALKTPSEEVQISVAETLTKLMKKGRTQDRIETILSDVLRNCLFGETLALRRGSAYGLSAAVKGSGITTLKKYEIVKQLEEACATGTATSKEGSLFAIELLSSRLGLLFEPYVIVLLPSLLKAFSDSSDHVRAAANNTSGIIMSKLSAHGVKLVMPAVLTAFNDPAWRTKQASIHMLGAMSHLAPKQLASALPKVVPQLTEAFSDTHTKVKASAQEALNEISKVVKNPEISSICPILLKALTDPASHTVKALEALIGTEFLHAIDAPSLALIVPILHRGLRDRGATSKRFGSLIAGNICTMINDPKDFVPYLPTLLPDLQSSLLDPIPDVRSTSAKAMGSLTRSLGDSILLKLRPWLIQKLRETTCSTAERSGAAQGLTEVLIASGSVVVEETMRNEILPLRSYPEASTREGVLWMLTFLPPEMGQGFTSLIDASLPALIGGLSDDSEPVRDVALRAGRVLIRSHGKVHVDKILPSLEAGLSDSDHRIRVASLSLLGDLLSMIGGTQVLKGEGDTQDDLRKAERAQAQIALAIGAETRKRILSGLYLARSDSVHMVRQSAIQVWKTVVSVTVRSLREILPILIARVIEDLASGHEEKTEVAGRCLGDVVQKLGDSVLPQVIPVLRNALDDGDEQTKRGVCVGLTEVIQCSNKEQILRFIEIIVKVVQDALSDDDEIVRKLAATSFQSLHAVVGSRAMDEVVPSLMVALENGERDEVVRLRALNGLTGILSVRSRELLPYIVPRLIKRPLTTNHVEVLAGVARVTGSTIHHHFSSIIPSLLNELAEMDDGDEEREQAIRSCCRFVCKSVDSSGVNWLISEIASKCGSDKVSLRRESCRMFENVILERAEKGDFYEQVPVMLREMLYRLNDENESVLKANHAAFTALSVQVPAEELVQHVEFMRNLIASMVSDARRRKGGVGDGEFLLPGFNMPKGVEPLIPIYQRGILFGSPTIREVSASGLGEVIGFTASKFLAGPLVVKMTGPLLRIVGDRNPANVKVAILKTLGLVLMKGGPALRAFVPQFQTTFVKALSDPSRLVRLEAIGALSLLMPLSTRVDPLIKELVAGSLGKTAGNDISEGLAAMAVQTATLDALAVVLEKGGTKAKLPDCIPSALEASKKLLQSPDEGIRESAAKVMGMSCTLLGQEMTNQVLSHEILGSSHGILPPDGNVDVTTIRHGKACAIRHILVCSNGSSFDTTLAITPAVLEDLNELVGTMVRDDKSIVREAGWAALGAVIGRSTSQKSALKSSEASILTVIRNSRETLEVHQAIARGLAIALVLVSPKPETLRVDFMGLTLMDACLEMAMKSPSQRVQFAFNDVLWLALNVSSSGETTALGLNRYCELAHFDNQRSMKSLYTKVLTRIKQVSILDH